MSLLTTPNVNQITVSSTNISGEVTLVAGTNISLTPSGQQITIAASGGGGGGITIGTTTVTSGTASRVLYEGTGNVVQEDSTFSFDDTNNILYVPEVAGGSTTSSNLMVSAYTNTFDDQNTGRIQFMERMVYSQSWTVTGSGGVLSDKLFSFQGTITSSLGINISPSVQDTRVFRYSTSQTVSAFPTFQAAMTYQPTTAVTDTAQYTQYSGFLSQPKYAPDIAAGTATTDALIGFASAPLTRRVNSGTVALTNLVGFGTYITPGILVNDLENTTLTTFYHFRAGIPFTTGMTVTNQIGVYIPAMNLGTNRYGYYSDLTASANYWDIYSAGGAQSSHEGLFKFGDNVAPTALVHTTGSTTARASMRVEAGTAPTTPNSGDLWHDSTRQCFMVYCGGMSLGVTKIMFAATAAGTVGNTTTETTLAGSGVGTLTMAANFLTVGKTFKVRAWGVYSSKAAPVGALTFRLKYGTTTLVTLAPTITASLTNQMWEAEFNLTCRTTGATGTVFAHGEIQVFTSTTASGFIVSAPTATVTIDTTASSKLDITAQWATANASNTITSNIFTAEVLY